MKKPLLLLTLFALSTLAGVLWYAAAHPATDDDRPAGVRPAVLTPEDRPDRVRTAEQPRRSAGPEAVRAAAPALPDTERRAEVERRMAGVNKPYQPTAELAVVKPAPKAEAVRPAAPLMYGPDGVPMIRVGDR